MTWLIPENKLDAQQRDFIDNVDIDKKNVWIKGFPGSGKSVLLAYTIRKIKSRNRNANILVIVFTHSLIKMFDAAFKEMGYQVNIVTFYSFMKSSGTYDYILSDEVQDLTPRVLKAMNERAEHVIVAGDENQSIYDRDPQIQECTASPEDIVRYLQARDFSLNIIHRLSSSIISAVQKFLPNLNIFTAKRDLTKQSTQVRLCEAYRTSEEIKYIMREAKKALNVGQTVGVLIPKQDKILDFIQNVISLEGKRQWEVQANCWGKTDYNAFNRYLNKCDIPLQYVGNGYGDFSRDSHLITIMTYHSSKGLDFDNVFIPFLNNSLFIVPNETLSKTLFMVAMTRSRNNLYLTYTGYKHPYLNNFSGDCNNINIHDALSTQKQAFAGDDIFAGF